MARRYDHSRDEIKTMAITAGQKLISSEGLNNFSARKIARSIGYTVGTIFNVFGDYDNIIFTINYVTLQDMERFILNRLQSDLDLVAYLKNLAYSYLEFAHNHYNRWSALFEHHLIPGDMPPEFYLELIRRLFALIETKLLTVLKDAEQAERAAKTMWASVHGIAELELCGKLNFIGVESLKRMMDSLIENYLSGLKVRNHLDFSIDIPSPSNL